jgi:hypothetical protein
MAKRNTRRPMEIQPKGGRDIAAPMGQAGSQSTPRSPARPSSPREAEITRRRALKKQRHQLIESEGAKDQASRFRPLLG